MNKSVEEMLEKLEFADSQLHRNLTVIPITGGVSGGLNYISLAMAMERGALSVSEISEGGSVPEVEVTNVADVAVLLIDGEELAGAKQNRVLNSTVLLKPKSKTTINVSCTERGRWAYESREFRDSDIVMERKMRASKNRSVSSSLKGGRAHQADQASIWNQIDAMSDSAGVHSETDAMGDVYKHRRSDTEGSLECFKHVSGQLGLVFLVNGEVVGMDVVSRADVYESLHRKIIQSYVIDSHGSSDDLPKADARVKVEAFLTSVSESDESVHDTVGYGADIRYDSRSLCGSALAHEEECVHIAFFANEASNGNGHDSPMRGYRQRRGFREE